MLPAARRPEARRDGGRPWSRSELAAAAHDAAAAAPEPLAEFTLGFEGGGLALAAAGHDVTLTDTPTVAVPSFDCEGAYEGDYLADSELCVYRDDRYSPAAQQLAEARALAVEAVEGLRERIERHGDAHP